MSTTDPPINLQGWRTPLQGILAAAYRVFRFVEAIAIGMGHLAGWLFLLLAFYITVDTLLRKYTTFASGAHVEMGQYVLAVGMTWAAAYTLKHKMHIRVDVLLARMPRQLQGYLNLAALALLDFFVIFLLWRICSDLLTYTFAIDSHSPTTIRTPLKIPQTVWAFGLAWLALYGTLLLFIGFLELALGNARKSRVALVPPSLARDIEEIVGEVTGDRQPLGQSLPREDPTSPFPPLS